PALSMGATGAVLALACAAPRACCELYDAVKADDHSRARELQHRLAPLSHIVTAGLGVPGLKAAMNFLALKGGAPRSITRVERNRDATGKGGDPQDGTLP